MSLSPKAQFRILEIMGIEEEWIAARKQFIAPKNAMMGVDHYRVFDAMSVGELDTESNCISRGFSWTPSKKGAKFWSQKFDEYNELARELSIQAMSAETMKGKRT